jgi:hypothetical protein
LPRVVSSFGTFGGEEKRRREDEETREGAREGDGID